MLHPRRTRAVNPQRRSLSRKQIAAGFGGKRRQASLKTKRHVHKHRAKASNPKRKRPASPKPRRRVAAKGRGKAKNPATRIVYRTKYKTRTVTAKPRRKVKAKRRASNPGPYLLTMAPLASNPHRKKRRKSAMAKTKRKVAAKRARKSNPTRRRSRRSNSHRSRRSNPFGLTGGDLTKHVVGATVGFSVCKLAPRSYPANWTASPIMSVVSTGLTALGLAWVANRFARPWTTGVLIGGGMATLNVAINAWAPPSLSQYASISNLGEFVPGGFPLPQGPVRYALASAPAEAPNGSQVNVGAFGRAW